jgi:hypothetical protein
MVMILYLISGLLRQALKMDCLDKLATFLFYALVVDFSLEILDFIQRLYEAEESIHILSELISTRLFLSLVVLQALLRTVIPLIALGAIALVFGNRALFAVPQELRRLLYLWHRRPHPDRHLQHAVECGHRRAAVLEKPPGSDRLQASIARIGRILCLLVIADCSLYPAIHLHQDSAALEGICRRMGAGSRGGRIG